MRRGAAKKPTDPRKFQSDSMELSPLRISGVKLWPIACESLKKSLSISGIR